MTTLVTPDAVEAAARAIHAARCDLPVACGRATSPDRQAAQLALAAAAPLIAQQTLLDQIAEGAAEYDALPIKDRPALRPPDNTLPQPARPAWSQQ